MVQKTLVLSPRVTTDANILMQVAKSSGQPVIRADSFRPSDALFDIPIAVYGESLFAIIMTTKLNHVVIEPTDNWLITLPDAYTKRHINKTTIGNARKMTTAHFVKNSDGMKAFDARVYSSGAELPSKEYYPDDYGVLVSEPVHWEVEYRCFIRENIITTLSIYLRNSTIARDSDGQWLKNISEMQEAYDFCKTLLDDSSVEIPPACVIDVGRIKERGWAVVEANPAYGSGIYGCDPIQVLSVINRATIHADEITDDDSLWITKYHVSD